MVVELPPKLKYAASALASVMVIGTVFYHYIEGWRWIDSLFFATYTITTVGYGEITPLTDVGKLFTIAYMLIGIGIALYSLSMIGGYYMEQRFEERALNVATKPREHLQKLRCAITPGHGSCKPGDEKKQFDENEKSEV